MRTRYILAPILIALSCVALVGIMRRTPNSVVAQPTSRPREPDGLFERLATQEFERILEPYQDWTFEQLEEHLGLTKAKAKALSFDPTEAAYYDDIRRGLKMTDEEHEKFHRHGLVTVDPKQRHSFASVYYQIYATDLPVLVTTDSVLHAWHVSYDDLLQDLEGQLLMSTLEAVLRGTHEQLTKLGTLPNSRGMLTSCRDVDLYLTVARNLLAGAADKKWDGELRVPSAFGNDVDVKERLEDIRSLTIQVPFQSAPTPIYGGQRHVDYSQFRARGHYTRSRQLRNYFRCMTWLGRADCGFFVLPVDPASGIRADWKRELRAAALLSQMVQDSDNAQRLDSICNIIRLLVGESDNLNVSGMLRLFESQSVQTAAQLTLFDNPSLEEFADVIRRSGLATQRIRSQAIVSDPYDTYKVPPPALFQLFGQAFVVDSLVLSHVVFDSIIFDDKKPRRLMPTSLDVAAAVGNDFAATLLEPELRRWNYSANLVASRKFVEQVAPEFWDSNVYHRWLSALRTLHQPSASEHVPQVMRRPVWRAKQLQTQLASWSELRHDNALYAKQSFTAVPSCQYPNGFIEPYPELYRKLGEMTTTTAARLADLEVPDHCKQMQDWQIQFLNRFAEIMERLRAIANRELDAQPMNGDQRRFVETTIDRRGSLPAGSGSKPRYDGWYCELFYRGVDVEASWNPTIIDVHTNPKSRAALQVGVGDANFAVVAIDNQDDLSAYVGPVYSYYEFVQPAEERLNDQEWQAMVTNDELPARPEWTKVFAGTPVQRTYDGFKIQNLGNEWMVMSSVNGKLEVVLRVKKNDQGLASLLKGLKARGFAGRFGISLGDVSEVGLRTLVGESQLAWIDTVGSTIDATSIDDFRLRRPDVQVLPAPLGVKTVAACRMIAGSRRYEADTSGELQPGKPLLLYIEAEHPALGRRNFQLAVALNVTLTLTDSTGRTILTHAADPVMMQLASPHEPVWTQVELAVPNDLEPGVYVLRVEVQDGMSSQSRPAAAELKLRV